MKARLVLVLAVALMSLLPISLFAQAPPDTTAVVVAGAPAGMDALVGGLIGLVNKLAPILAWCVATGLVVKYAPFMKWLPNESIRVLNALQTFFLALGGTASVAHAGFLGDFGKQFTILGAGAASFVVSNLAAWFYERNLRPIFEKLGIQPAGVKPVTPPAN